MLGVPDVAVPDLSPRQEVFLSWTRDVLVYTVVLNLFVEYVDTVVIDSFTISVFTAVVLKALLDLIIRFEHRITGFFAAHEGTAWRIGSFFATWAVLFGSKFVILEVIDIVFGDHVELGKLIEVIALVIALMVSRQLVTMAFVWIGENDPARTADP